MVVVMLLESYIENFLDETGQLGYNYSDFEHAKPTGIPQRACLSSFECFTLANF